MITSKYPLRPLGDVLRLDRHEVVVEPTQTYRTAGINNRGRGLFERAPILGNETSYTTFYRLSEGQIVFSRLFAFEGSVAVVGSVHDGLFVSNEFPTFSVKSSEADASYLEGLIRWPTFHDLLADAATGMGQRRQRVHPDAFLEIRVPVPEVTEQRRVAEAVGRALSPLDQVEHRLMTSQLLAAVAMTAAASRLDLTMDDRTSLGWKLTPLGAFLRPADSSFVPDASTIYRAAGVFSFGRGMIDRGVLGGDSITYASMTKLSGDEVIVSKLGGWEGGVTVVPPSFDGTVVSPEMRTFTVDRSAAAPSYLRAVTECPWFWDKIARATKGSMARRKRINESDFLRIEIWLPPIEAQEEVGHRTEMLRSIRDHRSKGAARFEALRPSILNRAFAGLL